MKGRKPQEGAIRRTKTPADYVTAQVVDSSKGLSDIAQKPDIIAIRQRTSDIWDSTFGDGTSYHEADVPIMSSYVFTVDAIYQLQEDLRDEEGHIATNLTTSEDDLRLPESPATNPQMTELHKLVDQMLKLADHLGISPLSRARLGLTEAAKANVTLSMAKTLRETVEEMFLP